MAGALTGRWDRLPRIAPGTRAVAYLAGAKLFAVGLFFLLGLSDLDTLIGVAFIYIPIFGGALIFHLRALNRSGPRSNASFRLLTENADAPRTAEHHVRFPAELWRDFPAYLFSQFLIACALLGFVATFVAHFFSSPILYIREAFVYGTATVVFFVLFLILRRRYLRLRDVDFATAPPAVIHVVAALLTDADGRALMVRKRGTGRFMQPGGKPEAGETGAEALSRELEEELGLLIPPSELTFVGQFVTAAANEEDTLLYADVFDAPVVTSAVAVRAEIEELLWVDPANPGYIELAPLSSDELLPLLAARRSGQSSA